MIKEVTALVFLAISLLAADAGTIPELLARNGTKYTNVAVTKLEQGRISFLHDDGMTTLPLFAFDDNNLERLIPGHLDALKTRQVEADKKEQEREHTRDTQRKSALEQNPAAAALAQKEDDIRETAIRYALTHFEAPDLTRVSAIILEIDRDTPSDEFLKRFANNIPPVHKMRRSQRREPRETELSCVVGNLKWVSDTEVEISASRVLGQAAVSFRYTVRFTNKGWEVVQSKITGIS